MSDWSHGYDVSAGYTYGFCPEMAPDWLDFCARLAGHAPRARGPSTPFRYLELGTGQGMGLCLLAAANPQGEFIGIDFMPEHVAHAENIAKSAGLTNVRFSASDFVELAAAWPDDFGTFDYVSMHGVYTWVSTEVRKAIAGCLLHATHGRSLVYNGYNTQPGWLGSVPFQHISRLLHQKSGRPGGAAFNDSITLFDKLHAGRATTFQFLPGLKARLDSVRTRSANYLAHEYLHESWQPRWHSEIADEFEAADLSYIGSATIAETMLPAVLPAALRDTITEQQDERLRQDLQDFVVNQFFRRDIFCRGPHGTLTRSLEEIAGTRLHLLSPPPADSNVELTVAFGEMTLQPQAFSGIVEALRSGPKSIAELANLPETRAQDIEVTLRILLLLLHSRTVGIAGSGPTAAESAQRLNAIIARGASAGLPYDHIAAPALGSAVPARDLDLMLLNAWLESPESANAEFLAAEVAANMAKPGGNAEYNVNAPDCAKAQQHVMEQATTFLEQKLSAWRMLGALA